MKKLVVVFAAMAVAFCAKSATVDWNYTGTEAEKGMSVYIFTSEVASNYETFADFTKNSVQNAVVTETSGRTKTWVINKTSFDGDLGDNIYFAIIAGEDATEFKYGSVSIAGMTYNPGAQQTSPGVVKLVGSNFAKNGTIGSVTPPGPTPAMPEPTSGLLLLVGGAALALRRRR